MKYGKNIIVACVVLGAIGLLLKYYVKEPTPTETSSAGTLTPAQEAALAVNAHLPMETITIGKNTLQVEIASTDAEREQGLSDRTSMPAGHGMLFVFDPPRGVNFWMKDMQFSLDMVFATADGVITKIDTNVTPQSYPELFPSGGPITYVLELPAGYTNTVGIAVGQKIVVQ
jgi:uncharacterized membrane protein (UPF0127 family)